MKSLKQTEEFKMRYMIAMGLLLVMNTAIARDKHRRGADRSAAPSAAAGTRLFTRVATNPGCHVDPSVTVIVALLKETETEAKKECKNEPQLVDVKVKIERVGGCMPSTVEAIYRCRD